MQSLTGSFLLGKLPEDSCLSSGRYGSVAASGPRNLNDCCQSYLAVRARLEQLLVRLVAPGPTRPLSFLGLLTAADPYVHILTMRISPENRNTGRCSGRQCCA